MEEQEEKILAHLVDAWNEFTKLPIQHPDDLDEFRHSLHRLQHLIGVRELRRLQPKEWYNAQDERW